MKLRYVLTCCLVIVHLSSDSVEARALTTYHECPKPETPCYGCKYNERCCGVREKDCNEQCKKVCVKPDGTKLPTLTKCPTKKKCKEVRPDECNENRDCTCTPLPPSQCKPICRTVDKEVCTQPDCFLKENCHDNCLDKDCILKCDALCPPDCKIVKEQICETPSCEKCVSCSQVPDCSVECGSGYCDGSAGERCEDDCTTTCQERFVPRCVPARPVRSKTPDDERRKKKKKGYRSGSDSDSDSSSGSDSDSSNGSDSDSDSSGSDSDSDSSGCGSDSDSDDCHRKHHH